MDCFLLENDEHLRILIVDDEPDWLEFLVELFKETPDELSLRLQRMVLRRDKSCGFPSTSFCLI